jgi:hypothetical protein
VGNTADDLFGPDPHDTSNISVAGPGTVTGTAAMASGLTGLRGMHPSYSPTPYVIGLALVLVLLLHPKAGFGGNFKAGLG